MKFISPDISFLEPSLVFLRDFSESFSKQNNPENHQGIFLRVYPEIPPKVLSKDAIPTDPFKDVLRNPSGVNLWKLRNLSIFFL